LQDQSYKELLIKQLHTHTRTGTHTYSHTHTHTHTHTNTHTLTHTHTHTHIHIHIVDLTISDANFQKGFNRIYDYNLAAALRRIMGDHGSLWNRVKVRLP